MRNTRGSAGWAMPDAARPSPGFRVTMPRETRARLDAEVARRQEAAPQAERSKISRSSVIRDAVELLLSFPDDS